MEDIELTLRLFMNHKQACQAIGRNGTNIKSLREETGCKVTISNKEHQNRVMTLQSKKSIAMKGKLFIIKNEG
jgi:transcription antitermination factor NusA-like protein